MLCVFMSYSDIITILSDSLILFDDLFRDGIKILNILLHLFLFYYDQLTPGLEANESCFKEQIPGVTNGGERLG